MLFDWGAGKVAQPARAAAGPVLVLAHRDELLDQARDKISRAVGLAAEKEKAEERATLDSRVVVGSVQTLSRFSAE